MSAIITLRTSNGTDLELARKHRDALATLVEDVRAMDLRDFETQKAAAFAPALVARMQALLQEGVERIGEVYVCYQSDEPELEYERSTALWDSHGWPSEASYQSRQIADLCFVAQLELRSKQSPLAAAAHTNDPWLVLSTCSSVKQKLIKSGCAVEQALCAFEGLQSLLGSTYAAELEISLRVRRAYNAFRRDILRNGVPQPDTIVARLRNGGVSIAKLIGLDVYEHLRSGDRMQLRWFQNQLLAWLRGDDDQNPRTGIRLWQDLAAFAGVLTSVNNRTNLRTHDLETATEVESALAAGTFPHGVVPDALRARLEKLCGRDEELDDLLASDAPLVVDECLFILQRLREELGFIAEPSEITPLARADLMEFP